MVGFAVKFLTSFSVLVSTFSAIPAPGTGLGPRPIKKTSKTLFSIKTTVAAKSLEMPSFY